tara:strand:- start:690 stop:2483 length:1794 start_codon:yes stop_codon:yes gene_type:complete
VLFKTSLRLLVALLFSTETSASPNVVTFYIDSTAVNIGDGSFQKPYGNLTAALASLVNLESPKEELNFVFRGGRYQILKTVVLTPQLFEGFKRVNFKAFEDEVVIISGSKKIGNWQILSGRERVVRTQIGPSKVGILFNDSRFSIRAREPDQESPRTFGPYFKSTGVDFEENGYLIKRELWDSLGIKDNSHLQLIYKSHWQHHSANYFKHKAKDSHILFLPNKTSGEISFNKEKSFYKNSYFYIENAYEFLDSEGEWFYDHNSGYLYYKLLSTDSPNDFASEVPQLDTIFAVMGDGVLKFPDISFIGLTFEGSGWNDLIDSGGVFTQFSQYYSRNQANNGYSPPGYFFIKGANNLVFRNNTFRKIGANAIKIHSNTDHLKIIGNEFSEIGANAIEVDSISISNPSPDIQSSGIVISGNVIARTGRLVSNGGAVLLHYVSNVIVENNTICDLPYSGIQIGNQPKGYSNTGTVGNIIRKNHIFNVMQLHDDGAAIYTLGGNQAGTIIEKNYIHDIERSKWAGNWYVDAIYLDNFTQFIKVKDNVIQNSNIGGERNNSKNNIFVNNGRDIKKAQVVIDNAGAPAELLENSHICELSNGPD